MSFYKLYDTIAQRYINEKVYSSEKYAKTAKSLVLRRIPSLHNRLVIHAFSTDTYHVIG